EFRKKSPNHLSGGQKQRVALAGVLAMQSKCIILDEATSMLDPVGRKSILSQVIRLNREKQITIILITHDMDEAVQADKVFVMQKGKVAVSGTPREIFHEISILEESKLALPDAAKIAIRLNRQGLPIRTDIITMDELEKELEQIFS
ncbi:MAG: ATP-binding cassette domain-containing protein, partial [Lachnospiraceae bacterium]|nr:ATP-binding cassette domain-containing protein [Lachnospiraceae bacterium]